MMKKYIKLIKITFLWFFIINFNVRKISSTKNDYKTQDFSLMTNENSRITWDPLELSIIENINQFQWIKIEQCSLQDTKSDNQMEWKKLDTLYDKFTIWTMNENKNYAQLRPIVNGFNQYKEQYDQLDESKTSELINYNIEIAQYLNELSWIKYPLETESNEILNEVNKKIRQIKQSLKIIRKPHWINNTFVLENMTFLQFRSIVESIKEDHKNHESIYAELIRQKQHNPAIIIHEYDLKQMKQISKDISRQIDKLEYETFNSFTDMNCSKNIDITMIQIRIRYLKTQFLKKNGQLSQQLDYLNNLDKYIKYQQNLIKQAKKKQDEAEEQLKRQKEEEKRVAFFNYITQCQGALDIFCEFDDLDKIYRKNSFITAFTNFEKKSKINQKPQIKFLYYYESKNTKFIISFEKVQLIVQKTMKEIFKNTDQIQFNLESLNRWINKSPVYIQNKYKEHNKVDTLIEFINYLHNNDFVTNYKLSNIYAE